MSKEPTKTIEEVVAEVGQYPIDAYQFIREGLSFAVEHVHGKETPVQKRIYQMMHEEDWDLDLLDAKYRAGELPDAVLEYLDEIGGAHALNRHVGGKELCWGLRDYALLRWGLLASSVLRSWRITCTQDFGRIVFALVQNGFLQKEAHDEIEDFYQVYDFEHAFDQSYTIDLIED